MTDMERSAVTEIRPALLRKASSEELRWLWCKMSQWRERAACAGDDTAAHEMAAGFILQEATAREIDLPDTGSVDMAMARCTLAQRLDCIPDQIVIDEDHVEVLCCKDGTLHVYGGFPAKVDRQVVADALGDVGIPISPKMEQWEAGDTFAPIYDLALVRSSPVCKHDGAPEYLTKADVHRGSMLSIAVPKNVAEGLAGLGVPGGEPGNMHLTLLYLGPADELDADTRAAVTEQVTAVCREHRPLRMQVTGAGYFAGGPDGVPIYASVSAVGLSQLQADLERAVSMVVPLPAVHGWVPHVTLGYQPKDQMAIELPDIEPVAGTGWIAHMVHFRAADQLVAACDLEGHRPLATADWDRPNGDVAAKRIACSANEKQIIYYLVSEPGTVDAHGHRIKADDIEDALHGYMAGARNVKLEHGENQGLVHQLGLKSIAGKALVVEGYIAPQELSEFHGQTPPDGPIAKGSSIVGIHYTDRDLWDQLKAIEHGISWGGYASKVTR